MDEFGRLFDPSWAALEARLAAVMRTALSNYWARHGDAFTMSPQNPANMQARPPCRRRKHRNAGGARSTRRSCCCSSSCLPTRLVAVAYIPLASPHLLVPQTIVSC